MDDEQVAAELARQQRLAHIPSVSKLLDDQRQRITQEYETLLQIERLRKPEMNWGRTQQQKFDYFMSGLTAATVVLSIPLIISLVIAWTR